jgi:hypothetical protein
MKSRIYFDNFVDYVFSSTNDLIFIAVAPHYDRFMH